MQSIRSGLVGLLLVALAAGWLYLYTHSHAVRPELQDAILGQLKDLKQLDSTWDVDVLKSQADINKSYDPLTKPLVEFDRLLATLDGEVTSSGDVELRSDLESIRSAIDQKTVLIDRFKADNALLKNSLRYVPTVSRSIQDGLRNERADARSARSPLRAAPPVTPEARPLARAGNGAYRTAAAAAKLAMLGQFAEDTSALVGDVLAYNSVPDSASEAFVYAQLASVSRSLNAYPPAVRSDVESLLLHLRALLRSRRNEARWLSEIGAVPVAARSDTFARAVTKRFDGDLSQQSTYQRWLLLYSGVVLVSLFGLAAIIVHRNATERRRLVIQVAQQTRELKESSLTDPLTGLRNRRFLHEHIERDVAASLRRYENGTAQPPAAPPEDADLIFLLVDIDHFKAVNDTHGHAAGDAVLVEMRNRLREVTRDADYLIRWGGEEFLIVARHTDRRNAELLAERIRSAVGRRTFALPGGATIVKTCSVGFACYPFSPRHPRMLSWAEVVQLADHELYRAKSAGRDGWAGFLSTDRTKPEATLQALLEQSDRHAQALEIRLVRSA